MSERLSIPYFWIAFYNDNTCLPQYDLETGKKNEWKDIDQSRLVKFGWFPFSEKLAQKVGSFAVSKHIPYFIIRLKPNQRLIALRREYQPFFSFSHCLKCNFNWQWIPKINDGEIGDAGLPIYGSEKYYYSEIQNNGKPAFEVICPKCGVKNDLKCSDCKVWWNKTEDEKTKDEPVEKKIYYLKCPKCGKTRETNTIMSAARSVREIFLLGWQETLPDGKNKKMLMFIHTDGSVEISDDFNYQASCDAQ